MAKVSRFQGGFQGAVYACRCCGKRTRETGEGESGVRLCAACYEDAGYENAHDDGHHKATPDPNCPYCKEGAVK